VIEKYCKDMRFPSGKCSLDSPSLVGLSFLS
jgi:hypothetical protein